MKILVLAGTADGRHIAEELHSRGFSVYATTVTEYGSKLFAEGLRVLVGALSLDELKGLLVEKEIEAIVDATHPFARDISLIAMQACEAMGLKYIRYERAKDPGSVGGYVVRAKDYDRAEKVLSEFDNIFLTIGSKNLDKFVHFLHRGKKLVARVLPDSTVIQRCEELGFGPDSIIAMKGPFSTDMNKMMFKEWGAKIVVTKDSGPAGGVIEKIEAAKDLRIPVILLERPDLNYHNIARNMRDILVLLSGEELNTKAW